MHPRVRVNRWNFSTAHALVDQLVTDVSLSGAFIRTDYPLEPGGKIPVSFTIVADDIATIEGVARIVRISKQPLGMGVEFTQLTPASRLALEGIVGAATRPQAQLDGR